MHDPIGILLFILIAVFGVPIARWRSQRATGAWQAAANQLGLSYGRGGWFEKHAISGRLDGLDVVVDTFRRSTGKSSVTYSRIRVSGMRHLPRGLHLSSEGFLSSISKALGGQDILTHDPAFDQEVRVRGQEVEVLSVLSHATRRLVSRELQRGVSVRDGEAYWETRGLLTDPSEIVGRVRGMAQLTASLQLDPRTMPERLSKNAREDTAPGLRLRNLVILQQQFPGSPVTLETSRALMQDADANVRLGAAVYLGVEGLETVQSVVESPEIDPRMLAEALQYLLSSLPVAQVAPVLERALGSPSAEARRIAIGNLGKLRHRPALARLMALGDQADPETGVAIAAALSQIGDPSAEPALVRWLRSDHEKLQIAAARGLGDIGTVLAVEPLLPYTKGIMTDGDLKRAARDAIDRIQGRLGDVEGGRLSIADVQRQDGALSLTSPGGELSMAEASETAAPHLATPALPETQAAPQTPPSSAEVPPAISETTRPMETES